MTNFPGKRIRDPVHGLIVFEAGNKRDELAWKLLNTPEMQRLRRIRQLGVSEFVYPGATHSRFAHSIGVYHCAKQLVEIIRREIGDAFKQVMADEVILAALLHDVGHGPFSHAFERAQKARGIRKRHEKWTAEIIRNPEGSIRNILGEERVERIAAMLEAEAPADIYHAVVSSSFDADRLDYIQRDRLMTGTHAGHIDFDWLMHNLRVAEIPLEDESQKVESFCFDARAIPAAEQFLLARYTLHEQVYFHKVTRAIENMISILLARVAQLAEQENVFELTGLPERHPLIAFFREGDNPSVESYLALDDMLIYSSLVLMKGATDSLVHALAERLRIRRPYKTYCLHTEVGMDGGRQNAKVRNIEREFEQEIGEKYVVKDDELELRIYSTVGGDDELKHKRLHVFDGGVPKEISDPNISRLIDTLSNYEKRFVRFYFANEQDRERARAL